MPEYTFRLSTREINRVLRDIKRYRDSIPDKTTELRKRVVELLEEKVREGFAVSIADYYWSKTRQGQGSYRDAPNVEISTLDNGDTQFVVATGRDAVFIEFGTGVYYNGAEGSSPHPKGASLNFRIGKYGKHRGRHQTWGFKRNGEVYLTHGLPAQMPMLNAIEEVASEIEEIAREVFQQ